MAKVPVAFVRSVLVKASTLPEVAARIPEAKTTVAVRITTDEEMAQLNRTYADVPDATDVLSFTGVGDHIGDIALSWPAIERQAAEFGYDAKSELALLTVHGFLHLLGWDHAGARDRKEMTRLTVAALERSRITLVEGRL
jgi:probable rRNA maturation factor